MRHQPPNKIGRANRRPASPLNAGPQIVSALCAPPSLSAAVAHLGRYVFKTATGNRPLELLPDGRVRWPYRQSATGQPGHQDMTPEELLRRFLQHVLPSGFHRVRLFGWFHPASRQKLNRVRALLKQSPLLTQPERDAWLPVEEIFQALQPIDNKPAPAPECPHCKRPMVLLGSWRTGQSPLAIARAPP